jgi:hypothetical protein
MREFREISHRCVLHTTTHFNIRLLLLLTSLLLVSAACNNSSSPTGGTPASQTPIELWQSYHFHNYSIDVVRSCFCPDAGERVRVTVRSDTVFGVVRAYDGTPVTGRTFFTIDSLFAIIHSSIYDSIIVRYNSMYGYPEYVDIEPQMHPVDGGVLYTLSNLQVLRAG